MSEEIEDEEFTEEDINSLWEDEDIEEEKEEVKEEEKEKVEEKEKEEEEEEIDEEKEEKEEEKEEPKPEELTARERVKAKLEKEQRMQAEKDAELAKYGFDDDDFKNSMSFSFPDREIEVDGEKISLATAAKDNPEVAALIKYAIGVKSKELESDITRLNNAEKNRVFWKAVEKKHAGARDFEDDDKFISWLKDLDDDMKTLINSSDPEDVITALDVWKASQPKKKEEGDHLKKKKSLMKKSKVSKKVSKTPESDDEEGMLTPEIMDKIWGEK